MGLHRIGQVAELLGVSGDTVRRWVDAGRLPAERSDGGRRLIDGAQLARFVTDTAQADEPGGYRAQSARNHLTGIVTKVMKDGVAAQVEVQAGRFPLVSLMTREAADELDLQPGMVAVASVKSTRHVIEPPAGPYPGESPAAKKPPTEP